MLINSESKNKGEPYLRLGFYYSYYIKDDDDFVGEDFDDDLPLED